MVSTQNRITWDNEDVATLALPDALFNGIGIGKARLIDNVVLE